MKTTIFTILLLIFIDANLIAQNIFATTAYNEIVQLDENDILSELVVIVDSEIAILDIAISPNNRFYGIIDNEIVEINTIDGSINSIISLPIFNSAQGNYTSLVCTNNYELYTLNNFSTILYKYDILADTLINVAELDVFSPGDMTLFKGNLIITTTENLMAFNLESKSFKTIFCINPEVNNSLLGIANTFTNCYANRIIATNSELYWELDLDAGLTIPISNTNPYITYGLASKNEHLASNCSFELESVDCSTITNLNNPTNENLQIKISPNPTAHMLSVQSNSAIEQIQIYDVTGALKKTIYDTTKDIDVSLFAQGMYFIQCLTNDKIISLQFIKH